MREVTSEDIEKIVKEMQKNNVDYVLFGGVSLNLHGIPRPTEDLDMFIRNTAKNVTNFFNAFRQLPMFDEVTEDQLVEYKNNGTLRYNVINFRGDIELDLTVSMGNKDIDSLDTTVIGFNGVQVNTITLQQLYEMKRISNRRKDKEDVVRILKLRGDDLK